MLSRALSLAVVLSVSVPSFAQNQLLRQEAFVMVEALLTEPDFTRAPEENLIASLLAGDLRQSLEQHKVLSANNGSSHVLWNVVWCSSDAHCKLELQYNTIKVLSVYPDPASAGKFCHSVVLKSRIKCGVEAADGASLWKRWGHRMLTDANWKETLAHLIPREGGAQAREGLFQDGLFNVVVVYGFLDGESTEKYGNAWTQDIFNAKMASALFQAALGLAMLDDKGAILEGGGRGPSGTVVKFHVAFEYSGVPGEWSLAAQRARSAHAYGMFRYGITSADVVIFDGHSRYGTQIDFAPKVDSASPFKYHIGSFLFNLPLRFYPDARRLEFRKDAPQVFAHLGCSSKLLYKRRIQGISNNKLDIWTSDGETPWETGPLAALALVAGIAIGTPDTVLEPLLQKTLKPSAEEGLLKVITTLKK